MGHLRLCLPLLLATLVCGEGQCRAAEKYVFPEGQHGKGRLQYISGVPVLSVAGTPEEIGEQVGVLALKPATRILDYPEDLLKSVGFSKALPLFAAAGNKMVAHFPADYQKEMEALVKAAGARRERVVIGNTLFD